MTVKNNKDLQGILRIGQICGLALQYMLSKVEPGISTRQLDDLGKAFLQKHNAFSAPITAYKFPGWTCISVNDEVAHGIPDDYVIQPGDMVNIDVSAVLEGYWGDTGASMPVPPVPPHYAKLCKMTKVALNKGIAAARADKPIAEVGKAVQAIAKKNGYRIIRELSGHGVGRGIHENPTVPNFYTRRMRGRFKDGQVVTIEPFFALGRGKVKTDDDGWTLRTTDGSIAAQYEHTVVITQDKAILVTKVDGSH